MPQVIIKTRDLDTDEKELRVLEIERVPDNDLRREQLLAEIVAAHHPEARQQSFAGGVASFVGNQHLIVARYSEEGVAPEKAAASDGDAARRVVQGQLFAA